MNEIPQMASIADLRNSHLKVLALLKQGPVVIASRSKPAAVLLSPEQWNSMIRELDMLWCEREAALAKLKIATGEDKVERLSDSELEEWLAEDEAVPA
jgi:PHD/YefM family antitoxin component YafN of YafNO toxin-antitoxin module